MYYYYAHLLMLWPPIYYLCGRQIGYRVTICILIIQVYMRITYLLSPVQLIWQEIKKKKCKYVVFQKMNLPRVLKTLYFL